MSKEKTEFNVSSVWYLVPIFFGFIGGLVMYLSTYREDKEKAKTGFVLGIITTAIGIMIYFGMTAILLKSISFHP